MSANLVSGYGSDSSGSSDAPTPPTRVDLGSSTNKVGVSRGLDNLFAKLPSPKKKLKKKRQRKQKARIEELIKKQEDKIKKIKEAEEFGVENNEESNKPHKKIPLLNLNVNRQAAKLSITEPQFQLPSNTQQQTMQTDENSLERQLKKHLRAGGDISTVSSNLLTVQEAGKQEDEFYASQFGLKNPSRKTTVTISKQTGKRKHQIGSLVHEAEQFESEFEERMKKNRQGVASAAKKYGW